MEPARSEEVPRAAGAGGRIGVPGRSIASRRSGEEGAGQDVVAGLLARHNANVTVKEGWPPLGL